MIKRYRKNKLNGSVLYTVVAVMMIMTVFIFAALSLASAANRRAFNSYANNQTQYTARSVVETVWDQIENNPELAKQIANLKGSKNIDVTLPDKSMGEVTNATVTYLGKGTDYGYDIDDPFYKLSVTVKMLGQENTLAGYFLPEKIENPSFDYALVSLDSGKLDNAAAYGGMNYGVGNYGDNELSNITKLRSPVELNGNLSIDQSNDIYLEQNSGMFINGNLSFVNKGNVNSVISDTPLKYRELPYLYVTKKINYSNTDVVFGSDNSPVIVMADSIGGQNISASNNYAIYGDVYLYDTLTPSTLVLSGGIKKVADFKNILNKQDNAINSLSSDLSYKCGNLYSLGEINTYKEGTLANNVVVKTLKLNADTATSGTVVAENINISGGNTFNFANGLFVDPDNFVLNYDTFINGEKFTNNEGSYIKWNVNGISSDEIISGTEQLTTTASEFIYYGLFSNYLNNGSEIISAKPTSITVKIKKQEGVQYDSSKFKILCKFYGENQYNQMNEFANTYGILDASGNLTFMLDNLSYLPSIESYTGKIYVGITVYPENEWDDPNKDYKYYQDVGKEIIIESLTTNFTITPKKSITLPFRNNKVDLIKAVNDTVFANSGNVIYIDDIDKSVKIEKIVDINGETKLEISKADLTGIEEGNELENDTTVEPEKRPEYKLVTWTDYNGTERTDFSYDNEYVEFLRAVVETVTFPESMKKENVLKSNGGFVDDSFLEMDAGKSKIAKNAKIEVDNAFSKEHLDLAKSKVYTHETLKDPDTGKYITITESCTLSGWFKGTINFKPASNDIYVLLDNNFQNEKSESDFIVVDDNNGQNRVNFLIPKGQNVKIIGNVLTKYYQDYLSKYEYCPECNIIWEDTDAIKCSHSKINAPIFQNPIVKDKISGNLIVDQQQIPGINFYMEYDENFENETDESKLPIIQFSEAHVSAYILAPTGYISLPNGGIQKKYTYKNQYSIVECGDFGNAIIGAVVSKKVNLQNICLFSYVNPNPKLPEDTEEELHYKARCIYYQSY